MSEFTYHNAILKPLDAEHAPAHELPVRYVDVNGREEHEAMLRDVPKMQSLGLDPLYERVIYLRRWGSWINGSIRFDGEISNE
jgi:hypothetical protein